MILCEDTDRSHANGQSNSGNVTSKEGRGSQQVKGVFLVVKQFFALLIKRFHHTTRSGKDFLAQVTIIASVSKLTNTNEVFRLWLKTGLFSFSDCVACKLCAHFSDVYADRSSIWGISQSYSQSLDVRPTVHLL